MRLGQAKRIGESLELVDEALGMHPAQGMQADGELAGIVADDHRLGQQAVRLDGAPERAVARQS